MEIKEKLVSVRDNMQKSIGKTEQTIVKIGALGSGIQEAGQKAANAFRSFADKDTVDYAVKEKSFQKQSLQSSHLSCKRSCIGAWKNIWMPLLTG